MNKKNYEKIQHIISFDYASLYPNLHEQLSPELIAEIKAEIKRKQRIDKLKRILNEKE